MTGGGPALNPSLKLADITFEPGYIKNEDYRPWFITVKVQA